MAEMEEMKVWSLGGEDPQEEGMATHSSLLAWRIPWTEEPGGLQSIGSQRVGHGWSDLAHTHAQPYTISFSPCLAPSSSLYHQRAENQVKNRPRNGAGTGTFAFGKRTVPTERLISPGPFFSPRFFYTVSQNVILCKLQSINLFAKPQYKTWSSN